MKTVMFRYLKLPKLEINPNLDATRILQGTIIPCLPQRGRQGTVGDVFRLSVYAAQIYSAKLTYEAASVSLKRPSAAAFFRSSGLIQRNAMGFGVQPGYTCSSIFS